MMKEAGMNFFNELEDDEMYKLFGNMDSEIDKDWGVII